MSAPDSAGRPLLLVGVAGACVLGVALGLWARPGASERRTAPSRTVGPAGTAPAQQIQIVVDDRPAPLGPPLEVMRPAAPQSPEAAAPPPAEVAAPARPPAGLVRVQALAPAEPLPVVKLEPAREPEPRKPTVQPARKTSELKAAAPKKAQPTKAESRNTGPNSKLAHAKAHDGPAKPDKKTLKAEAKARHKHPSENTPATVAHQKDKAAPGRHVAHKAKPEADAETAEAPKPSRLSRVIHALAKIAPHRAKPEAEADEAATPKLAEKKKGPHKPKAEIAAKARKTEKALTAEKVEKVEKAVHKLSPAPEKPKLAEVAPPPKAKPVATHADPAAGPLRVASARPRCASADPGAALVCADPTLGAVDRRLNQAYREAQAAGVPTAELDRQQRRWLAARSAAAREAPWAVHDVYLARISELREMTRDAEDGY